MTEIAQVNIENAIQRNAGKREKCPHWMQPVMLQGLAVTMKVGRFIDLDLRSLPMALNFNPVRAMARPYTGAKESRSGLKVSHLAR